MPSSLRHLHSLIAALPAEWRRAAGSKHPAMAHLMDAARGSAARLLEAVDQTASSYGGGRMRVMHNLLATVPAKKAGVLYSIFRYWIATGVVEEDNGFAKLVSRIPVNDPEDRVGSWLLAGGAPPTGRQGMKFFGGHPAAWFLMEADRSRALETPSPARTAKLLRTLEIPSTEKAQKNIRLLLLSSGFAKGLAPLDPQAFWSLPPALRCWIFADSTFAAHAVSKDFLARVKAHPERYGDTPESKAHAFWLREVLPQALKDLRGGEFRTQNVRAMLSRKGPAHLEPRILHALRAGVASTAAAETLSMPAAAGAASQARLPRLHHLLQFLGHNAGERLAYLQELRKPDRELLLRDITPAGWGDACAQCVDIPTLKRSRASMLERPAFLKALFARLIHRPASAESLAVWGRDVLLGPGQAVASALVAAKPEILAQITADDIHTPSGVALVDRLAGVPDVFPKALAHVTPEVQRALWTSAKPEVMQLRQRLMSRARRSRSDSFRRSVLYFVLTHAPGLLQQAPVWKVSDADFRYLLSLLPKEVDPDAVFRLAGQAGVPCWERFYLRGWQGRVLRSTIHSSLPDLRERLDELEFKRLWAVPGLRSRIRKVLAGTACAGTIGIPQWRLRHLIPWARDQWKKKPTVAVAYELALAFSIADARFLSFLSTERWKSTDKDRGGHVFDHHYRVHTLPKKSGGTRLVTVPSDALKRLQGRILRALLDPMRLHPAAHGFRKERSILTNAMPHVGHPVVVNVDIKSFFPSTRYGLIHKACSSLAGGVLSEAAVRVLADLCSYAGGLPTGAPTSPALANLILRSADAAIAKAAAENNIVYTRYADDLTFSGASNTVKILPFVGRVLGQLGYELDHKKTNIFRRGRRQIVTGIVVNEKPNLPRRIRRRLRAAVHQAANGAKPHWHGKTIPLIKLRGRLGQLGLVQPEEAAKLRAQLPASRKTKEKTANQAKSPSGKGASGKGPSGKSAKAKPRGSTSGNRRARP